jgi:transposase
LDDYITEDNPIRVVDVFVDELKLHDLGFDGAQPAATGRPSYHPAVLLKIYMVSPAQPMVARRTAYLARDTRVTTHACPARGVGHASDQ